MPAVMGVLKKPMAAEAAKAGFYEPPHHAKVPRIRIMTMPNFFEGKKPQVPTVTSVFRKAGREEDRSAQAELHNPEHFNKSTSPDSASWNTASFARGFISRLGGRSKLTPQAR